MRSIAFSVSILASLALAGCPTTPSGSDDAGNDAFAEARPSCEQIIARCHDVDPGSGPIHDCHEGGHDANPAWCAANAERCYQLCTAAHANVDGGARDGATSHDAHATTDASATDAVASDVHQH